MVHFHTLSYTFGSTLSYTFIHFHRPSDKLLYTLCAFIHFRTLKLSDILSYTFIHFRIHYRTLSYTFGCIFVPTNVIQNPPTSLKTSSNIIQNVMQRHSKRHPKRHPTSFKTSSNVVFFSFFLFFFYGLFFLEYKLQSRGLPEELSQSHGNSRNLQHITLTLSRGGGGG